MATHTESILGILERNAKTSDTAIAAMLGVPEAEARAEIDRLERERVIVAYTAIIDDDKAGRDMVKAVIEVRITPERGGGFNRLAERIARFDEVTSCFLMSGGYDLLVFVEGRSLREVARFVSEKLSTLEGVLSTSTHFTLKTYKDQGVLHDLPESDDRLKVTP